MHRMLVVVFDDEKKANEGKEALLQLEREGCVSIYHYVLVEKRGDGTTTLKCADQHAPVNFFVGDSPFASETPADATAAALTRPAGLQVGMLPQPDSAATDEAFVNDVRKVLLPNRVALVADVEEEFTTPVDSRMEPLGGVMFRWVIGEQEKSSDITAISH